MTRKIFTATGIFCVAILLIVYVKVNKKNDNQMLKVESGAFRTSAGWGYNILVDHKIYIHQEWIPAIEGKKAFANKQDALKTADVAIQKLTRGKQPCITKRESDSLKISL